MAGLHIALLVPECEVCDLWSFTAGCCRDESEELGECPFKKRKCPRCGNEMLKNYRLPSLDAWWVCENTECGYEEKVVW